MAQILWGKFNNTLVLKNVWTRGSKNAEKNSEKKFLLLFPLGEIIGGKILCRTS